MPLRIFAAASGFASASSNMRTPSPVNRRAIVKGVSFGWTWYVGPAPATVVPLPIAAAQVLGPTMPSGTSPCCACQVFVAAAVAGPNFPSGATPMIFCQSTTSEPLDPCWIVACVVVVGVGGDTGVGAIEIGTAAGTPVGTDAIATPCAAAQVSGPTMPSGLSPCCVCQVFVAAAVAGPNLPSGVTPRSEEHTSELQS